MPSQSGDKPVESTSTAFEAWRKKLSWSTGLGLSDKENELRDELAKETQCKQWKRDLLVTSPKITFMIQHLRQLGYNISSSNLHCAPCEGTRAGGTHAATGNIIICQGKFMNKEHMEDAVTHELLHLYDHANFNIDWSNLRHHACSEIRAENLSGDCRWGREVQRGFMSFTKQQQECVRRRAILSVRANPACPDEATAERVVNEVFESCIKDTRPFDEANAIRENVGLPGKVAFILEGGPGEGNVFNGILVRLAAASAILLLTKEL